MSDFAKSYSWKVDGTHYIVAWNLKREYRTNNLKFSCYTSGKRFEKKLVTTLFKGVKLIWFSRNYHESNVF